MESAIALFPLSKTPKLSPTPLNHLGWKISSRSRTPVDHNHIRWQISSRTPVKHNHIRWQISSVNHIRWQISSPTPVSHIAARALGSKGGTGDDEETTWMFKVLFDFIAMLLGWKEVNGDDITWTKEDYQTGKEIFDIAVRTFGSKGGSGFCGDDTIWTKEEYQQKANEHSDLVEEAFDFTLTKEDQQKAKEVLSDLSARTFGGSKRSRGDDITWIKQEFLQYVKGIIYIVEVALASEGGSGMWTEEERRFAKDITSLINEEGNERTEKAYERLEKKTLVTLFAKSDPSGNRSFEGITARGAIATLAIIWLTRFLLKGKKVTK